MVLGIGALKGGGELGGRSGGVPREEWSLPQNRCPCERFWKSGLCAPPPTSSLCSQESECVGWSPRSWIVSGGSTWTVCAGRSLERCSRNFGVGDSERRWPVALVHPKQKEGVLGTCRASFQPSPSVQRHSDPRIIYSSLQSCLTHPRLPNSSGL